MSGWIWTRDYLDAWFHVIIMWVFSITSSSLWLSSLAVFHHSSLHCSVCGLLDVCFCCGRFVATFMRRCLYFITISCLGPVIVWKGLICAMHPWLLSPPSHALFGTNKCTGMQRMCRSRLLEDTVRRTVSSKHIDFGRWMSFIHLMWHLREVAEELDSWFDLLGQAM